MIFEFYFLLYHRFPVSLRKSLNFLSPQYTGKKWMLLSLRKGVVRTVLSFRGEFTAPWYLGRIVIEFFKTVEKVRIFIVTKRDL